MKKKYFKKANVLVIGGTGTGKTFKYIKPSLLQENRSIVVTDPPGNMVMYDRKHPMLANKFTFGFPGEEKTFFTFQRDTKSRRWKRIISDVAKTFRRIYPELSENNAMETAKRFMESEMVASYCVGRWMRYGNSMAVRQMKKKYGDEPFRFDRNGWIQGVNKFVLSKWIQERNY